MSEETKGDTLAHIPEAVMAALSTNEQTALEMLVDTFGGRVTATLDEEGLLQLQVVPEKTQKARNDFRAKITAPGFRFAHCTKAELHECLKPHYADIIKDTRLLGLWMRISDDATLDDLDLFEAILSHPNLSTRIVDELAKLVLTIPPEKIKGDEEKIHSLQRILFSILRTKVASPEICKLIITTPHLIDHCYERSILPAMRVVFEALKKSGLDGDDIDKILTQAEHFKTIMRFIDIFASQLPNGIVLELKIEEVRKKIT